MENDMSVIHIKHGDDVNQNEEHFLFVPETRFAVVMHGGISLASYI